MVTQEKQEARLDRMISLGERMVRMKCHGYTDSQIREALRAFNIVAEHADGQRYLRIDDIRTYLRQALKG